MGRKRKNNEEFIKEIWNLVGEEYTFLEEYEYASKKILCKHNICEYRWRILPSSFLRGTRCPKCAEIIKAKKRIKTNQQFEAEVYKLVGNEYSFLDKYITAKTKIKCIHNTCGYIWYINPNTFFNGCRCPKCAQKQKPQLQPKSNTEFIKEIQSLVGEEYIFLENYIGGKVKILCRHNVCGHEWRVRPNSFLRGNRCPKCSRINAQSKNTKTNKDFLNEVKSLTKNEYEFLEKYDTNKIKILCKHKVCGYVWKVRPDSFLNGRRCPKCARKNSGFKTAKILAKTNEKFISQVKNVGGNEYVVLDEYVNAHTKMRFKHLACNTIWATTPHIFLNVGSRCPICTGNISNGEYFIQEFLDINNINYQSEYRMVNCRNNKPLPFDFGVFSSDDNLIGLIEYDGKQHFEPVEFFGGQEQLENQQQNDTIKNQYCADNNIPLLRIPYWEFDNIEQILEEWLTEQGVLPVESLSAND